MAHSTVVTPDDQNREGNTMPINWKNRAKKMEEHLLSREELIVTLHKKSANLGFSLEREKALHRRTLEENHSLHGKLKRARTLLYGAAENLAGHGCHASGDALQMAATDLMPAPRPETDGCALTPMTAKDEQY
jgi:hypothetical protein